MGIQARSLIRRFKREYLEHSKVAIAFCFILFFVFFIGFWFGEARSMAWCMEAGFRVFNLSEEDLGTTKAVIIYASKIYQGKIERLISNASRFKDEDLGVLPENQSWGKFEV